MYHQCRYVGGVSVRARVQRWGNSLALRIPQAFGKELNLRAESSVDMTVDSGRLILVPIEDSPVATLSELLDQVSDENRHTEVQTGRPVGYETW
jgi:antitoxin MazE